MERINFDLSRLIVNHIYVNRIIEGNSFFFFNYISVSDQPGILFNRDYHNPSQKIEILAHVNRLIVSLLIGCFCPVLVTARSGRRKKSVMLYLSRHAGCPLWRGYEGGEVPWKGLQFACLNVLQLYCKVFDKQDVFLMLLRLVL